MFATLKHREDAKCQGGVCVTCLASSIATNARNIPYIGNFSRRENSAKRTFGKCVKFSLSHIFAISKTLNEYVDNGLLFAVSIFCDF